MNRPCWKSGLCRRLLDDLTRMLSGDLRLISPPADLCLFNEADGEMRELHD